MKVYARPSRGVRVHTPLETFKICASKSAFPAFWGKNQVIFDRTIHTLFSSFLFNGFDYLADKIVAKSNFLVTSQQNQIGPCSKVFKTISWNLIQKRTELHKYLKGKTKQIQYIRFCGHYQINRDNPQAYIMCIRACKALQSNFKLGQPFASFPL